MVTIKFVLCVERCCAKKSRVEQWHDWRYYRSHPANDSRNGRNPFSPIIILLLEKFPSDVSLLPIIIRWSPFQVIGNCLLVDNAYTHLIFLRVMKTVTSQIDFHSPSEPFRREMVAMITGFFPRTHTGCRKHRHRWLKSIKIGIDFIPHWDFQNSSTFDLRGHIGECQRLPVSREHLRHFRCGSKRRCHSSQFNLNISS